MAEITTVLLHGLLGDRHDWASVTHHLTGPWLALDLPGHGEQRDLDVADFAECDRWLRDTLSQHGVTRYRLAGYSLGGRIALYHASLQPQGLTALWLENSHPGLPEVERAMRLAHDARWARRFESEPLPTVLHDWYCQGVFSDLDTQEREHLIIRRLGNRGEAVAAMLRATSLGHQPELRTWLATTTLPVTYVAGRRDHKFHNLACQLATPGSTIDLRVLDGGHNLHAALPEVYARELARWATQPEEKST